MAPSRASTLSQLPTPSPSPEFQGPVQILAGFFVLSSSVRARRNESEGRGQGSTAKGEGTCIPRGKEKGRGLKRNRMARGQTLKEQEGKKTNKLAQGKRNQRGLR